MFVIIKNALMSVEPFEVQQKSPNLGEWLLNKISESYQK